MCNTNKNRAKVTQTHIFYDCKLQERTHTLAVNFHDQAQTPQIHHLPAHFLAHSFVRSRTLTM